MDNLKGITTLSELNIRYPISAIRQSKEEYYTVYSLKDNKLAYIIFLFSPDTGVTFYIKDIFMYPSDNVEHKLPFLMEKDLPVNILK